MKQAAPGILVAMLFLVGCAMSGEDSKDLATLQADNVSPAVYAKMKQGAKLSVEDVADLGVHHVSDDIILRYLKKTRAIYNLSTQNIEQLKLAHVSEAVINYMLSTPKLYLIENTRFSQPSRFTPSYYNPVYDPIMPYTDPVMLPVINR